MTSKIHTPPNLSEEQMLERLRQAQVEKDNGQLIHFDNAEQFREFLASPPHDKA